VIVSRIKWKKGREDVTMTQSAKWFMDVAGEVFAGMGAQTNSTLNEFVEEHDLSEGLDIQLIQLAYGSAPESITPEHVVKRSPYGNPEFVEEQMREAVERGWLEAVGEGQYVPTEKGQQAAADLFALADRIFGGIESLPDDDLKRITALLSKVVARAQELPEPDEKWVLSWGSRFDRGPDAPLMVQVRRRLIDLLGFRDDVHVAAWQPYGVGGQVWEAFTYIWRGEAGAAAELAETLSYRNYDEAAYVAALEELVSRGWIAEAEGKYITTEEGKVLRQQAEDATNRYFDAAWSGLSEAEVKEVHGLLEKLADAVKPPEEDAE
jgi:DNA-binding MarR family transcriptional regulator